LATESDTTSACNGAKENIGVRCVEVPNSVFSDFGNYWEVLYDGMFETIAVEYRISFQLPLFFLVMDVEAGSWPDSSALVVTSRSGI
jgi:hypothetical protein